MTNIILKRKLTKGGNMKIGVERNYHTPLTTGSIVRVNGLLYGFGIEPGIQWEKGPVSIGEYPVQLLVHGILHDQYKRRFPFAHKGMLEIVGVPGRDGILIHIGNSYVDTRGCLLVGKSFKDGSLYESEKAYIKLYIAVIAAAQMDKLSIHFYDGGERV
jgi:hypothetical protein